MSKKKYVMNLSLNIERFSEEVIEGIVAKVYEFIEKEIESHINLGKSFEVNTSIQVTKGDILTFEILLELNSSMPIPLEYEVTIDRIMSNAFRFIENLLTEVDLDGTTI
ncbi:MAG: hypothetical protein QXO98_04690 [Sulfolobales archaeon]